MPSESSEKNTTPIDSSSNIVVKEQVKNNVNTTGKATGLKLEQSPNVDCFDASRVKAYVRCGYDSRGEVCGCDNITYKNACEAEKSGIAKYKYGKCTTTKSAPQ